VPEVTVGVDGVVVVLEPSRRRRCARRPLPSDAGSSPKDTQLSEQICASEQHRFFVVVLLLPLLVVPLNLAYLSLMQ